MAQLLCRFYEIVDEPGMFLSPSSRTALAKVGHDLFCIYSSLVEEALAAVPPRRAWKATQKFHLFQHLCEWQGPEQGNPRSWWTYADEDLMLHISKIAKSSHKTTMAEVCLYKWAVLVFDT